MQFLFAVSALLATVLSQQITPGDYRFKSTKCPIAGLPTCLLAIREGSQPHILNVGFDRYLDKSKCTTTGAMPPFGYLVTFNYNGTSYVDVTKGDRYLNQSYTITIAGKTVNYARKFTSPQVCDLNYELELVTPRPRGK